MCDWIYTNHKAWSMNRKGFLSFALPFRVQYTNVEYLIDCTKHFLWSGMTTAYEGVKMSTERFNTDIIDIAVVLTFKYTLDVELRFILTL